MKRVYLVLLSSLMGMFLIGCEEMPQTTTTSNRKTVAVHGKSTLARVTTYWASGGRGSDRYTRHHKSSTGARLREGHCAVDPRRVLYGSQVVYSDGTTDQAVDTGSAVISRRAARRAGRSIEEKSAIVIDKFFETKRQALLWAKTHPMFMPVQIIPPIITKSEESMLPETWKR